MCEEQVCEAGKGMRDETFLFPASLFGPCSLNVTQSLSDIYSNLDQNRNLDWPSFYLVWNNTTLLSMRRPSDVRPSTGRVFTANRAVRPTFDLSISVPNIPGTPLNISHLLWKTEPTHLFTEHGPDSRSAKGG